MKARRIAVIGGGWAGISAAIEATSLGAQVSLFEMAPQLGGRARSIQIDGLALDNGQHILIGAYVETLRMMRIVGVDVDAAFLRTPLKLVDAGGHGLQLPSGHPVLAFAQGVLRHPSWSLIHRMALLYTACGWAMRGFRCDEGATVSELVRGLPPTVRDELIDPLCVAALNTPAHSASGTVFLRVIRDALFSGRGAADLLLPRQRLSELLPQPAKRWLIQQGTQVREGVRVERVDATGVSWQVNGETFDAAILASSASEAARLAGSIKLAWAAKAAALDYEPIVTVYAQSDGTRLPSPMVFLPSDEHEHPAQFVFDHGHLGGRDGLLAFVISGAASWMAMGANATREATLRQGQEILSAHLRTPLRHLRTLTEKRATFRCVPGLDRPHSLIAPGLIAAGDYIAGPYPATLEGSIRCAVDAARTAVAS